MRAVSINNYIRESECSSVRSENRCIVSIEIGFITRIGIAGLSYRDIRVLCRLAADFDSMPAIIGVGDLWGLHLMCNPLKQNH